MKEIKMLTLDTSTTCTGIAKWTNGKLISSTVLSTDKKLKGDDKLNQMITLVINNIKQENPQIVVTEQLAVTRNAVTVGMLKELLGAIRGYCVTNHIDYYSLRPSEWRKSVSIFFNQKPNGRKRDDQKAWAIDIVNNKLGICTESDDQAESILLGIGYGNLFKCTMSI